MEFNYLTVKRKRGGFDQVRLLASDNVADPSRPGLLEIGITPTPVDTILPQYLARFRPRGRFAR